MFVRNAAALAMLILFADAAPMPKTTPNGMSPGVIFTPPNGQSSINDCGDSTFNNNTSGASPRVSDCLQIASNIAGGGTWTTEGDSQRTLVSAGTCALGVDGEQDGIIFKVGNQDIIDLIHSSINMFQSNGLVGASGRMPCQALSAPDEYVNWGLYHA